MDLFGARIHNEVSFFLNEYLKNILSVTDANEKLFKLCGIELFFKDDEELNIIKKQLLSSNKLQIDNDKAEYGDFQTNDILAQSVIENLVSKGASPQILVEPTCGTGTFLVSSLAKFFNLETVIGIEINKGYTWETKFNIIHFYILNPEVRKPRIVIHNCSVFEFNFNKLVAASEGKEVLLIGNPPWVTNSKLGSLQSQNVPAKSNFKNHRGLEAITGKGNFDIAEFILITLIQIFQNSVGSMAMLVKNSVVKNILVDQQKNRYRISEIEKHQIDSKKEFRVSVDASLFYCRLNSDVGFTCSEFNIYDDSKKETEFGWLNGKFVSNISNYIESGGLEGVCPFIWRQGLKHDCSSIMELDRQDNFYANGLNEKAELEEELVYGILKSSDLKDKVAGPPRKFTIVTQRKVGQDTAHIKLEHPQTYSYLIKHLSLFEARKSSIYLNKPLFSIFGIGDYSFKPFKVAISGLYKTFHFSLVIPHNSKPVMLDDTCYMLGFESIEFAVYTLILLNSEAATSFFKSITFKDAKRLFTKDVLMRIDLNRLANDFGYHKLEIEIANLNHQYNLGVSGSSWGDFLFELTSKDIKQIAMFA